LNDHTHSTINCAPLMPPGWQDSLRVPGVEGVPSPGEDPFSPSGGRGPLNLDDDIVLADVKPGQTTKPAPTTIDLGDEPPPTSEVESEDLTLGDFTGKLFSGPPSYKELVQGNLASCPLAAALGAGAYAKKAVKGMITEKSGSFVAHWKGAKIACTRQFTVTFSDGVGIDVSSLQYQDGRWPVFGHSLSNTLGWPAFIEKAYAKKMGGSRGYNALNDEKITANQVMQDVFGSGLDVKAIPEDWKKGTTDAQKELDHQLTALVKDAAKSPTIAASRDKAASVVQDHGFVVLGFQGSKVDLWNPWGPEGRPEKEVHLQLTLEEFKNNFEMVLQSD
jgi:hypothetical protein